LEGKGWAVFHPLGGQTVAFFKGTMHVTKDSLKTF
jgi:hypothetical protein